MTDSIENLLPSQEIPVKHTTLTDDTVTNDPSVGGKTKKKIKLRSKSIKGKEFFKEGFLQGSYQQSIGSFAKGILIGFLLCLLFFSVLNISRKQDDFSRNVSDDNNSKCQKRIIGYYSGTRKITEEQIGKLTHIIFNGIRMQEDGKIEFGSDEKRLMFLDMKNKARIMKSDVQLMFATDAYNWNGDLLAPVMADPKLRKVWINSVASFILEEQLDGVEIVYRWPETAEDKKNFAFFVRELRYKLAKVEKIASRKAPYIISIYSNQYSWTPDDVSLLDDILNYVNFFNVETDNFYAPWHKNSIMTGPLSPLYSLGNDNQSIDWTMKAYTCKTMKPSQLNVKLSLGGVLWKNVSKSVTQVDDLHFNVGGTNFSGNYFTWRCRKVSDINLAETSWHDVAKTHYIWLQKNQSFITFENERSLEEKMEYILSKNLGGVTVQIDDDDVVYTLLNTVTSMNMCSGPKFEKEEIKYNCGKL